MSEVPLRRPPHEVLGVPADATKKQVRRAYKRLARRYHPDANKEAGATARFLAIKAAHDEMIRLIDAGFAPRPRPTPQPTSRATPPQARWTPPPPRARPPDETIRPPPKDVRPLDMPEWYDLEDRVPRREIGRMVLYVGAAVFWLSVLWSFHRMIQLAVEPPEQVDTGQ